MNSNLFRNSFTRTALAAVFIAGASFAQSPPACGFGAPSAAIGADVPETYFGPPPSTVQKELVGPLQLLTAGKLDQRAATITLPLYKGKVRERNQTVWYVLTDTTDRDNAVTTDGENSGAFELIHAEPRFHTEVTENTEVQKSSDRE